MPKTALGLFLFCLFHSLKIYGQADALPVETDSKPKLQNTIWLNTGQLLRQEIQLSYERRLTTWLSAESGLGYKYAVGQGKRYYNETPSLFSSEHFEYAERMPFSQGILTSLALKFYLNQSSGYYLSAGGFYRYRFYRHQLLSNSEMLASGYANWDSQQSLDLHIYGTKILFGSTVDLGAVGKNSRLLFDFYFGFSYRWKRATTAFDWKNSTAAGYASGNPNPPLTSPTNPQNSPPTIEKATSEAFAPQLGVKLGFVF